MTGKQRQRVKSDLISGRLFEVLSKANGQAHLWVMDNGVNLLFSTNPLADGDGLIVKKLPIPLCTVSTNRVAEQSRDAVKDFLKTLIAAEPGEAHNIIMRAAGGGSAAGPGESYRSGARVDRDRHGRERSGH